MASNQSKNKDRAFWLKHIEQWKKSNQTKAAYCRANGLNADLFAYYFKQSKKNIPLNSASPSESNFLVFEPSQPTNNKNTSIDFKFTAANGNTLEWSAHWSTAELTQFLGQWAAA